MAGALRNPNVPKALRPRKGLKITIMIHTHVFNRGPADIHSLLDGVSGHPGRLLCRSA